MIGLFLLEACAPAARAPNLGSSRRGTAFAQQVDQVARGKSRRIIVEDELISDSDLAGLVDLAELRELTLRTTRVGDVGLSYIGKLVDLEKLVLGETSVTDAGLKSLTGLKQLKTLNFERAEATAAGFAELTALEQLVLLRFGQSRIGDDALAIIDRWPKLRSLILQRAPITDAGLAHLKDQNLAGLESLYLEGTEVSEEGLADLQQALPRLHIHPHPD
ncbi:MAG TPA: hypothetical protein VGX78_13930 [Pirellulales bacterium]|nr:hypothetical protein [Pirellulales bacterium]